MIENRDTIAVVRRAKGEMPRGESIKMWKVTLMAGI
jgi:hypothetical protein